MADPGDRSRRHWPGEMSMMSACPSCGRPNEAGAKFCSECGTALAARGVGGGIAPGRVDASGERRQLTIMFCDLVGSTTLASRLDPEDTREVIGACLRMITQVVERFGGYVARYVGDGALVYFGYPQANEDDTERGVEAGLRIIEEAASLKLHDGFRPQFRVGIATGLVVVGDIVRAGAPGRSDVAGETPHLAARLQALAEPDTVVISHGTRQLAGELFSYRDLGPVALKGFAEPVRAFQVLAPTGAESRFEALRVTRQSPLVGRDAELDHLEGLWRKACDGKGQVALLHGDPGIGKSRLTAMLSERIADQPHTRIRYYCSWHQQGSPFQPFINQLERAANIDRADTPAVKFDKLAQVLSPGSSQDEDLLLVADLLSVSPSEGPPIDLAPLKLRERTMEALLRQAALLSAQRPLLMVFEDVHWIDPSSLDLLKLAVQRIPELPILLIVTFRPAFQSPWSEEEAVSIALSPLDRDDSVALVQASAGPTELPPQVVAEIIERSDGIPLFVEELTRSVVDGRQGNGDGAATVPTTLHASLMSRLDRLGEAKAIALIGATIGREFTYELVAGLARRPEPELKVAFDQLTASGLIRRRGVPPAATYQFTHALLHEAAYRSMLRDTRRDLHADLAVILEDRFPETAKLRPDLLAHHCAEAGKIEKAVEYCLQAGRSAFARSAIVEAIGRLERGLELVGLLPEGERRHQLELGLYLYLTQALIAHTGYTSRETYEAVEHARRTADKLGEPPQLAAVLSGQWAYSLISNQLTTASRRSAELLGLGRAGRQDLDAARPPGQRRHRLCPRPLHRGAGQPRSGDATLCARGPAGLCGTRRPGRPGGGDRLPVLAPDLSWLFRPGPQNAGPRRGRRACAQPGLQHGPCAERPCLHPAHARPGREGAGHARRTGADQRGARARLLPGVCVYLPGLGACRSRQRGGRHPADRVRHIGVSRRGRASLHHHILPVARLGLPRRRRLSTGAGPARRSDIDCRGIAGLWRRRRNPPGPCRDPARSQRPGWRGAQLQGGARGVAATPRAAMGIARRDRAGADAG